jgi:tetratricopeptide (TPR) repeat protein
MAYLDLGKYAEAEKWLLQARLSDQTFAASEYNLGRIAFELGRYDEACERFEGLLKKDPDNVMVLKAAAFARLKRGDLGKAETYYKRVVKLSPDSVDSRYNYALVLNALGKYTAAERLLLQLVEENKNDSESLLLLARTRNANGKIEALDDYARYLKNNDTSEVRLEYAQALVKAQYYGKALENYEALLKLSPDALGGIKKADLYFEAAQILLFSGIVTEGKVAGIDTPASGSDASGGSLAQADQGNQGLTYLKNALREGFKDSQALSALLQDPRLSKDQKEKIEALIKK